MSKLIRNAQVNRQVVRYALRDAYEVALLRIITLVLGFVCASGAMAQSLDDDLDPIPPWDMNELVVSATNIFGLAPAASVRLLAWQSVEGAGKFRIDSALLWARYPYRDHTGADRVFWKLLGMFRHPLNQYTGWRAVTISHIFLGHAGFTYPPKSGDVYAFVERAGWKLPHRQQGFAVLGRGIRSKTWTDVIGEAPTLTVFGEAIIEK